MKTIYKQSIIITIILLLIGVSVSSAISVDTKSNTSNNQSEECRDCNEVSDADLIRVERLLNRVEVYSKLLLVLSKYNPELREISEELSNDVNSIKEEYKVLILKLKDDYPIICYILDIIFVPLYVSLSIILEVVNLLNYNSLLFRILLPISYLLEMIVAYVFGIGDYFDCWFDPYPYIL